VAERGLPSPEKQVQWLHVGPGGWIGVTVVSEIYWYKRHWVNKEPVRCLGDRECPLCRRGIPWRMRYVMKVAAEDGEWLLELGAPQFEKLSEMTRDGGILGRKIEIRRAHRGKTARIELVDKGVDPLVVEADDIGRLVDAVEAGLADPPSRR